jgi:hypothetical protein
MVREDSWDERAQALVDPQGGWYWESRRAPDLDVVQAQHAGLVAALEAEGVDVVEVEGAAAGHLTRPIYTRDPLCTVPGGAVIGRMAPAMRRGEERMVAQTIAALGMPILRTIHGTGLLEGGSFVKLTPELAAYGTSFRCNEEGARQLREVLDVLGIELLVMPMGGYSSAHVRRLSAGTGGARAARRRGDRHPLFRDPEGRRRNPLLDDGARPRTGGLIYRNTPYRRNRSRNRNDSTPRDKGAWPLCPAAPQSYGCRMAGFTLRRTADGRWSLRAQGCCGNVDRWQLEYEQALLEQLLADGGTVTARAGDRVEVVDRKGKHHSLRAREG